MQGLGEYFARPLYAKLLPPDVFSQPENAQKCVGGRGSAPDPTGGAYSTPPDHLAGLTGPTSKGRGEEGRGGKGNAPLSEILKTPLPKDTFT